MGCNGVTGMDLFGLSFLRLTSSTVCCLLLVISGSVMSRLSTGFIDSCARNLGGEQLKIHFPWDGSQYDQFLSKKPSSVIKAPEWVDLPAAQSDSSAPVLKPTRLNKFNAKRQMSELSWVASENNKLNLALQCWKVIIMDSTSSTDLGKILMQCIELGRSDDYVWQIISDTFSQKSTATLRARSASLLVFGRWKRSISLGSTSEIFPISEEQAYQYLCELRCMKAAPSKGRRFVEALGFAKGLIGAKVDDTLSSARVRGAASGLVSGSTRKKCPFTVDQLVLLERLAIYVQGQDAIFAGYLCFLVHCRLRWSDGQHCIQEPTLDLHEDRGFIEAALYHHKTARKRRSTVLRLLPVAGVIPGLSGQNWAEHWLRKRAEFQLRGSMKQPMMPATTAGGLWTQQPLTSSEANLWLREILGPWCQQPISGLATHSAKATVLSWMAKANVDISLRRLAGYHVIPGDKSALEYSRDAAAPVLRQIEAMFIAIRSQSFNPDLPRSQRWSGVSCLDEAVQLAASALKKSGKSRCKKRLFSASFMNLEVDPLLDDEPKPASTDLGDEFPSFGDDVTLEELRLSNLIHSSECDGPGNLDDASDMSDLSESVESSTDSDSGSDDADRQALINGEKNSRDLVAPSDLSGKTCFKHVKSQKLHFVERPVGDVSVFRCGRKCNANYVKLTVVPSFAARGCMTCFGWSDKQADASDPDD